jgi:hypothetical protein
LKYYKVLQTDGTVVNGGSGQWPLPVDGKPGKWLSVTGKLVPCKNGLHVVTDKQLLDWLGPAIFEVELWPGVTQIDSDNKLVVRKARLTRRCIHWNEATARLFAADCAERVLPLFEDKYPQDDRPRKAIEAARAYARGEIRDAARDAAWAAAWDAAGVAAWAAARAAARNAARAAARAAAGDAARDAARVAAWADAGADARDAAKKYQVKLLRKLLK